MTEAERIAELAADEAVKGECENVGLAYYTAELVVKRLQEA